MLHLEHAFVSAETRTLRKVPQIPDKILNVVLQKDEADQVGTIV
jgi:hypothetical protein